MKTKYIIKRILFLIGFCTIICGCTSDEINGPKDENTATYYLCKYWWRADYIDFDDANISQQFNFNTDGSGSEILVRSKLGQTTESKEYFFTWYWTSDRHVSICIEYSEKGVTYMDQIMIMDDVMTCFIGSDKYTFYGLNRNGY